MSIGESTTRLLLVRCGGQCVICRRSLLESGVTYQDLYLGERAHNVGRSRGDKSPRGQHDLDLIKRDDVDNLLLLCGTCHGEIDNPANLDVFTVQRLAALKEAHEARISQLLAIPHDTDTTVLRLHGTIGPNIAHVNRPDSAAAVIAAGRLPNFLSHDRIGVEIDLRSIGDADPANTDYYDQATAAIDRIIERQISPAIEDGAITHLSVFALARWPLLVYLGSLLGDKVTADVYQRHRATERWDWPDDDDPSTKFGMHKSSGVDAAGDAVLVMSMSAAVHVDEVPDYLNGCVTYRITPSTTEAHRDVINSCTALKSAERAFRRVFDDLEEHHKDTIKRLHVIGAAPLSACVTLGRVHTSGISPTLHLYDRTDHNYLPTLEIR